jgi:zinc protease
MTTALERGLSPAREVLPNGTVVLAQQNRGVPAVAISAAFDAGSVTDPDGSPGLAYLAAKTLDRGTQARSAAAIADLLDERGVSLRVAVARHTLTITSVCLAEDLDEVLRLVAEMARRATFPQEQVEKRRIKAITSVRQDADSTSSRASAAAHQLVYGALHPYGRPRKGTPESLERITRSRLLDFASTWLTPGALRVAVAGELEPMDVIERAARLFGDWEPRTRPLVIVPVPPAVSRAVRVVPMPGKPQTDIACAFSTLPRLDPRYYGSLVMNTILGQFGLGGRLADNIRERQGLAYYAYSTLDAMPADCPLVIRVGVDPENLPAALTAIDAEVRGLALHGPTPDEFTDAVESLVGGIPRLLETNETIAEFLQATEQFGLGIDHDRQLPGLLRAVTRADVVEAARDILDPDRASIAIAGPHDPDDTTV